MHDFRLLRRTFYFIWLNRVEDDPALRVVGFGLGILLDLVGSFSKVSIASLSLL